MSGFVDTLPAGNTQAKTPTVSHKLNLDELLVLWTLLRKVLK